MPITSRRERNAENRKRIKEVTPSTMSHTIVDSHGVTVISYRSGSDSVVITKTSVTGSNFEPTATRINISVDEAPALGKFFDDLGRRLEPLKTLHAILQDEEDALDIENEQRNERLRIASVEYAIAHPEAPDEPEEDEE